MLGFIIGTACLIGLVNALRHRRYDGGPGYPRGYTGPRGFGARRWMLRSVLTRLDTTPGQEKAIAAALEELEGNRGVVREESRQTRTDLARAVASGVVDDVTLEETFARHDRLLAQLRVSFVEALRKVTDALDDRQRKQLADFLERGRGYGHPRWTNRVGAARDTFGMWA